MKKCKYVSMALIALTILHATAGMAKGKKFLRFPLGCLPVGFSYGYYNLVLQPTAKHHPQTLYLIKNKSNHKIKILQQVNQQVPYIIQSKEIIKGGTWAAFATDSKKFSLFALGKTIKAYIGGWLNVKIRWIFVNTALLHK